MGLIVRMLQSLPLVIVLVILAIVIYFVVSWMHSPTKAKEVLIRFFTVISIVISWLVRTRFWNRTFLYWRLPYRF